MTTPTPKRLETMISALRARIRHLRSRTRRCRGAVVSSIVTPWGLGAVFNLNRPPHYVHWHFFQMSVSNIVVILLMILVFALAIALPFPGQGRGS